MPRNLSSIFLTLFLVVTVVDVNAQMFAPDRDWASATNYVGPVDQDSIFVFFSQNSPALRAQFSDSSAATYTWYKYDQQYAYQDRFRLMEGLSDSVTTNLGRGGYRVEVVRIEDDSTEVYTAWVMIDDVEVLGLNVVRNTCTGLELVLNTMPNFFDVNSLFAYNDLSLETHQERNALGTQGYFANHQFESTSSDVAVNDKIYSLPFIYIEYENQISGRFHGPLFSSAYRFTLQNPFGRGAVEVATDDVEAVSTKADFEIRFWDNDTQSFGGAESGDVPSGEALLEMELKSLSLNSDSLYWRIHNDKLRIAKGGDSLIWRDSSLFDQRVESYPEKKRLIPGFYNIEHTSVKKTSSLICRDTLTKTVEVDTSFIQNIPNVFTPGGMYSHFKISEDDLRSLKSFKIVILSRSGRQVYRYVGDPKEWEGWNGKIDGTKGDAPTGVYYYVIDAVGWDGVRYRNGQYKGFLHLYR